MEQRVAECGLRSRGQCRAHLPRPPSAASPGILAYTSEDVDILDRRARLRSDPRGTMSRIHNLRLRQRLLRLELRDAKRRLMVPDSRWTYDRQYSSLLSRSVFANNSRDILFFLMMLYVLFTIAVHVEESMDWRDPSFLEALEAETCILQKRVHACKSHVLLITCFDSCPRQSYSRQAETSTGIRIT